MSNDRHAVDESAVIMYAIQAIERDVANAVSDCQKVLNDFFSSYFKWSCMQKEVLLFFFIERYLN